MPRRTRSPFILANDTTAPHYGAYSAFLGQWRRSEAMGTICTLFYLGLVMTPAPYACADYPDISQYELWVTAYDPALGGPNCMEPCDLTATYKYVPDWYGRGAGCPLDLMLAGAAVHFGGMDWPCIDTGGGLLIDHDRRAVRVDLLMMLHAVTAEGEVVYQLPPNPPWYIHTTIPPGQWSFSSS